MRRGSKYDPLREHLISARADDLTLSIDEIEEILGFSLPPSATTPQWWANIKGSTQHTQYRAWRDAGYDAFLQAQHDEVRFKRAGALAQAAP